MLFEIRNLQLQSGLVRPRSVLSYQTYGQLNRNRSNAILLATPFGARHESLEWMLKAGGLLDISRYFVIVPDMFGNGLSSSPVQEDEAVPQDPWTNFTIYDNVIAQYRLVTGVLGISRLALVTGWSMGGQQAYQWASAFPALVDRLCVICGSAKTSPHNFVFLEGIKAALINILEVGCGDNDAAMRHRALRSVARIYAGWALSQAFYREEVWRRLGYSSLEEFLQCYWEKSFLERQPENLLAHIWTWQHADISANTHHAGNLPSALAGIRARALLMPCETDLYFTVDDSRLELKHLRNAALLPIRSLWGHRAGMPVHDVADQAYIKEALEQLLRTR